MSGKKKLLLDGEVLIFYDKNKRNFNYSFKIDNIVFKVKQITDEQFNLIIDNKYFNELMEQDKNGTLSRLKEKMKSNQYIKEQEEAFKKYEKMKKEKEKEKKIEKKEYDDYNARSMKYNTGFYDDEDNNIEFEYKKEKKIIIIKVHIKIKILKHILIYIFYIIL